MNEKSYKSCLTESIKAAADISKNRFIGFSGALCSAKAKSLGVSLINADAGEVFPCEIYGIVFVEASAPIAAGATVASAADGKAITLADTYVANGYALDAAAAAGDIIRVKLI